MLLIFLFLSSLAQAQLGTLIVKKHGYKKVASFPEGAQIKFQQHNGMVVQGQISLIKGDSIYINYLAYPISSISRILINQEMNKEIKRQFLFYTAGVILCTAGLILANFGTLSSSVISSMVIGYGNFIIKYLRHLKRGKYNIGRKFVLQPLDLRM